MSVLTIPSITPPLARSGSSNQGAIAFGAGGRYPSELCGLTCDKQKPSARCLPSDKGTGHDVRITYRKRVVTPTQSRRFHNLGPSPRWLTHHLVTTAFTSREPLTRSLCMRFGREILVSPFEPLPALRIPWSAHYSHNPRVTETLGFVVRGGPVRNPVGAGLAS